MKAYTKVLRLVFAPLLLIAQVSPSFGQEPARLKIEGLSKLQDKAIQTIDVTLDQNLLTLACKFLSDKRSPDEAKIKEVVAGLKGIYVRSYEFDSSGQYSDDDLNYIQQQLKDPAWSRVVGVTCKRKGEKENIQVYLMNTADRIDGLAALAAGEKDLTVINIVGSIDVEKLSSLCGSFGIPKFDLHLGN